MNKKLELEFSELLIAAYSDNVDRMAKILNRLDHEQKEKLARALLKALYPTLYYLPGGAVLCLKKEFGFDIDLEKEIASCQK